MRRTIYTPSSIDPQIEKNLWNEGLIVFDTCALLDFYYMTPEYQTIMSDILCSLSYRIWLPAQVVNEYEKNRNSGAVKPINEKYHDKVIQNNHLVDDLKSYIGQWGKQYYHPFISPQKLQEIKDALNNIEPEIAKIKTIMAKEYTKRKQEIKSILNQDYLAKTILSLKCGEPFLLSEIKEILKEGAVRYANQIPPGYKDAEMKSGIRKYGDLIIWKETLRHAKAEKCDIIFVTNETKPDWVIVDETDKDKNAEKPTANEKGHPRRELLVEFEEETGQTIWFYKTSEFINKIESLYQPKQTELEFYGKLGLVRDILARAERDRKLKQHHTNDSLLIRCNTCGELFELNAGDLCFDWEGGVVDDRGMGPEAEYESQEYCSCPNCGNQLDLTLQVWEYPMGAFNTQNIEINGGEIEESINLESYISFENYEECMRCGERAVLNDIGLCERCEADFDRFVNSDD